RALTPSMFQSSRIFCVDDIPSLSQSDMSMLAEAVKASVEGVRFFVSLKKPGGSVKSKKALTPAAFLKKLGLSSESSKIKKISRKVPREYELPEWVVETAGSVFGRKIEKRAAEKLVEMKGADTGRLYSELDKLDIYLNEKDVITEESIDFMTDASRDVKPYELPGIIAAGRAEELFRTLDLVFKGSFSAPFYISVVFSHFWKLARIRSFAVENMALVQRYKKNTGNYKARNQAAFEIGVGSGILRSTDKYTKAYPVMIKPGMIEQAQRYKEQHLKRVFRYLLDYDLNMKRGVIKVDKNTFMDLCFKIMKLPDAHKEKNGEILLQGRV
ncbi:MAG: DNA polymerase III subunit delta, partial [Chitinivibrionales bacterium]